MAEGINVEWHNYRHPYYNQLWLKEQGFISHLSLMDIFFNHGPEALIILTGRKLIPRPEGIKVRHADEVMSWGDKSYAN
ncbi:MAG: WbqC family protein [Nitrospirae bacterium]|nr:WbqC family protein [Nitrospirota bacterium]